ncbi:glycosyltransferase family 4 protein [Ralstonia sp. 21MJYT02-11]|uniref:Glycosyltransferase family 4 protein n=1 Tax=Ralstonia soli TaxID=2953896 RepID=A0ABT1AJ87_9RALS|nr:glycosyltransferase family 4 protein [Ralstonia soli]MCO5398473.1 glycosyltransferase family 4 protein [Ralstonia soli]
MSAPSPLPLIAYVITNSEVGGAQAHVADLLKGLRGRVDAVVLAGGDGPLFANAHACGAKTVRLGLLDNALSPWRALAAFKQLVRALRAVRPDLIHAHSAKAGALGRLAGWLLGIPVVYTVHGFAFKEAAPARQRIIARTMEWLLAPLTARMICVAEAEREIAETLPIPRPRIRVIHNGIADSSNLATPRAPVRRIVMVARLAAPKRADTLIRAFARAALPDCELILAGDGPQSTALRTLADTLAPGRIRFYGVVTHIPALLASAQIFALVSDHEGFPLSVLEAMRAGMPIVASDLPGIREQLADGDCGVLIPGNDEQLWVSILTELAANQEQRENLGNKARARWKQHFGVAPMADATLLVYRQVLAARPQTHRREHSAKQATDE